MALRGFYNEIRNLKLKDLPAHVKPMLSIDYVKKAISRGMDNYHKKYILTGSPHPLYHVCFGGMAFSYLVAFLRSVATLSTSNTAGTRGMVADWGIGSW